MTIKTSCIKKVFDKLIVLKEKKSKLIIDNIKQNEYTIITVDGCVITNGLRCDYLIIKSDKTELFIELKGSDIEHAANQLEETYIKLKANLKGRKKEFYIVSPRSPLSGTAVQELKKRFKRNTGYILELKRSPCNYRCS